jgi:MFS family permease
LSFDVASEIVNPKVGYFRVLGNRSFFYLWAATLVSRTGDNLLSIAMLWFVYAVLTHNPLYAGLIAAAYYLPTFLFAPLFGKITDSHNRKNVMIAATLCEMAFAVLLYLAITFNLFVLQVSFITVFSIASFGLLVAISRSSSIPLTVPKDELTAANSLQQATTQLTRIFGFLAGGVLLLIMGIRGIVLLEIAVFIISAATLRGMNLSDQKRDRKARSGLDGLRYIKNDRLFLEVAVFLSVVNFTGAGMIVLPAIMATTVFKSGPGIYASILVFLAVGTVAGNYIVTRFNAGSRVGKILILSNTVDAFLYILFAYSGNALFAVAISVVIGFVEGISIVPFVTLIQARTPNERLGGVLAALSLLLLGSASLSMMASGFLVSLLGVQLVYLLFAILMLITCAGATNMKELRNASY